MIADASIAGVTKERSPMTENIRYLPIPLDIGDAPIPVGMSEDDFQLRKDTLDLRKKKIACLGANQTSQIITQASSYRPWLERE
jgi:hypothetical protein